MDGRGVICCLSEIQISLKGLSFSILYMVELLVSLNDSTNKGSRLLQESVQCLSILAHSKNNTCEKQQEEQYGACLGGVSASHGQ